MKAQVVNVEVVEFSNGTKSKKVFARAENGCMGVFYTTADCKVGSWFSLEISTDNKQQFSVRKQLIQQ